MDSLKVLDPDEPIREADSSRTLLEVRFVPKGDTRNKKAAKLRRPDILPWFDVDDYATGTAPHSGL